MDPRLEPVDKLVSDFYGDAERELAFAVGLLARDDAAELRWLAACATVRADELDRA